MEPTKDELHPQKYSTKLRRFTTTIIISSKLLLMQDRELRSLQNYGKTAFEATYGKTAFEAVFWPTIVVYSKLICSGSHIINENINFVLRTNY